MTNVFAALATEAVAGFAIAGAITAWVRNRFRVTTAPVVAEPLSES